MHKERADSWNLYLKQQLHCSGSVSRLSSSVSGNVAAKHSAKGRFGNGPRNSTVLEEWAAKRVTVMAGETYTLRGDSASTCNGERKLVGKQERLNAGKKSISRDKQLFHRQQLLFQAADVFVIVAIFSTGISQIKLEREFLFVMKAPKTTQMAIRPETIYVAL